uniref:Fibronectin type III domain-containing protein n=1 Tax=Candidatus Kentrum sp. LFY TaxID=2126342 RepID=A0A450WLR6_9GAMM|nr:MAG: Fibronectin type III domain-containing protein [Candidatus Kentron sp. LFY]
MKRYKRIGIAGIITLFTLSGCSIFTPPLEQPLITDYQTRNVLSPHREFGSSSLTASRRMVLFKLRNHDFLRVCAEPPPTVGEELNRAFQAAVSASVKKETGTKEAEARGNLLSSLATSFKQFEKSKGIQFEQDMLYSLCQLHMNGAITNTDAREFYEIVADRAERILLAEIKDAEAKPPTTTGHVLNHTRQVKDGRLDLYLKVLDKKILSAHSWQVVTREASRFWESDMGWKQTQADSSSPSVSKNYVISATIASNKLNVGNKAEVALLLEAGLEVESESGASKMYYPATGQFVFYKGDADKASVRSDGKDKPLSNEDIPLTIIFPKYVDIAFPEFSPRDVPLTGGLRLPNDGETVPIEITFQRGKVGTSYRWNLRVPDENDRQRIREARAEGNVTLVDLEFDPQRAIIEIPGFKQEEIIALSRWGEPQPVTNFEAKAIENNKTSLNLSWSEPEDPKTGYLIKWKRSDQGGFDSKNKKPIDVGQTGVKIGDLGKGEYNFKMVTLNQTRVSEPATTKGEITK